MSQEKVTECDVRDRYIYLDMDASGDSYKQLSHNLVGHGSGSSDMVFYLPMSLFTGQYVNLFSQFGNIDDSTAKYGSQAGFEECIFSTKAPREMQFGAKFSF